MLPDLTPSRCTCRLYVTLPSNNVSVSKPTSGLTRRNRHRSRLLKTSCGTTRRQWRGYSTRSLSLRFPVGLPLATFALSLILLECLPAPCVTHYCELRYHHGRLQHQQQHQQLLIQRALAPSGQRLRQSTVVRGASYKHSASDMDLRPAAKT